MGFPSFTQLRRCLTVKNAGRTRVRATMFLATGFCFVPCEAVPPVHGTDGPPLNAGDRSQEDPDDPVLQAHGRDEPAGDAVDKLRESTGPASVSEERTREPWGPGSGSTARTRRFTELHSGQAAFATIFIPFLQFRELYISWRRQLSRKANVVGKVKLDRQSHYLGRGTLHRIPLRMYTYRSQLL